MWCRVLLRTTDSGFSLDSRADLTQVLWARSLEEHLREVAYCAGLAGSNFSLGRMDPAFGFSFYSYNQGYEALYQKVFSDLRTFVPDEQFFENQRKRTIEQIKNFLISEPY